MDPDNHRYMKMTGAHTPKHLAMPEQVHDEGTTLCGRPVNTSVSWRDIKSFEGDECAQCKKLTLGLRRGSDGGVYLLPHFGQN